MGTTRDKACRRSGAFSLIELVMVVFIVTLIAAVAQPRYVSSLSSYRTNMAAKRIAADLAYARSNAWSNGVSQVVTFTPASNQYQLSGMQSLDKSTNSFIVTLSSDPYCATLYSASFGGATSVTFDAYGFPSQGGQVVVRCGGFQKTVTLDQATGNVAVQ